MMRAFNFSAIPASTAGGRVLRRLARLIPDGTLVRVLQGPACGMKWIVGAQTHGMWLGSYERDKQEALSRAVRSGDVFLDAGANVGFYTLIASRLVRGGKVFAFEPLPRNLHFLRRHVSLNGLSNVTVVPKALAEFSGRARFSTSNDSSMNRLDDGGEIAVSVTTVDSAIEAGELLPPNVMKIDVEGAELSLLRGAVECMRSLRPVTFVALHSASLYAQLQEFIRAEQIPYTITTLDGAVAPVDRFVEDVVLRPHVS